MVANVFEQQLAVVEAMPETDATTVAKMILELVIELIEDEEAEINDDGTISWLYHSTEDAQHIGMTRTDGEYSVQWGYDFAIDAGHINTIIKDGILNHAEAMVEAWDDEWDDDYENEDE